MTPSPFHLVLYSWLHGPFIYSFRIDRQAERVIGYTNTIYKPP